MTTSSSIIDHLEKRFAQYPIVFWHDPNNEFNERLSEIEIPGVEVLEVNNNEFTIKHKIITRQEDTKYLVYRCGAIPTGADNWLLDQELAYGIFSADTSVMLAQDLGTDDPEVQKVISGHPYFFRSEQRITSLRTLLHGNEDAPQFQAKMCAALLGKKDHSLQGITRSLLIENANGSNQKLELLRKFDLVDYFWKGTTSIYGYESENPTMDDFVLWMFQRAFEGFAPSNDPRLANIKRDFEGFRTNPTSSEKMRTLAERAGSDLRIWEQLADFSIDSLLDNDCFKDIERKIILSLTRDIEQRSISHNEVESIIAIRQSSIWMRDYSGYYDALRAASKLLTQLTTADLNVESFEDGLSSYVTSWFTIDQSYRQFYHAYKNLINQDILHKLSELIEARYLNDFIVPLGAQWQEQVTSISEWKTPAFPPQAAFYNNFVRPLVTNRNKKAVVIISDAMRYEIGEELSRRILQEDRFEAKIDAMVGAIPSYTQLGMAALLPHESLRLEDNLSVLADGAPTLGTANRTKILANVDGAAFSAESILEMKTSELRELYSQHQVFYIYHNRIDETGDKMSSERKTFSAAEEAITEVIRLIRKITSANATNLFVTADHGFLYQESELEERFFLSQKPQGEINSTNRRFAVGKSITTTNSYATFSAKQLGFESESNFAFPNSMHRYRVKGAGTRFVHGGTSLQEILIPVVSINKTRSSTTRQVNIQPLNIRERITTQHHIQQISQTEPVSEKIQPVTIRVGIFAGDNLISNQVTLRFNSESKSSRDWIQEAKLTLTSDSESIHNTDVEVRGEYMIPNTSQWSPSFTVTYKLERTFGSDFDF